MCVVQDGNTPATKQQLSSPIRKLNMTNTIIKPAFLCLAVCMYALFCTSCESTKNSVYFLNQHDTTIESPNIAPEVIIHNNDLLSISVSTLSTQASAVFNSPNTTGTASTSSAGNTVQASGYLVNSDGYIKFPFLGAVKASGLSEQQLEDTITHALISKQFAIEPIVTIRHLNFKVTVLGEVNHPAVLTVTSERISFLEAIGLAGDLTIYAKRDNVLLIREESNKKIVRRINLNSSSLFTSPYYYLKSNDVIYVEPNKAKVASAGRNQYLVPILLSALSFAAILVQVFKN